MRSGVLIIGVLLAVASCGTPARAFQEVPVPPPADAQPKVPGVTLDFGTPAAPAASPAAPKKKERGGFLPKLDFGLDLLYSEEQAPLAPAPVAPQDDVGVMGTIKRRF